MSRIAERKTNELAAQERRRLKAERKKGRL